MLGDDHISCRCSEVLSKSPRYQRLNDEIISMAHEVIPVLRQNGYTNIERIEELFFDLETCIQDECYKTGVEDGYIKMISDHQK